MNIKIVCKGGVLNANAATQQGSAAKKNVAPINADPEMELPMANDSIEVIVKNMAEEMRWRFLVKTEAPYHLRF